MPRVSEKATSRQLMNRGNLPLRPLTGLLFAVVFVVTEAREGRPTLVDYLKIARRARKQESRSDPVADRQATGLQASKLLAAGWKPKERCGKTIWKRPDNGFYCSQEMAAHFLDKGVRNVRCKSGANQKG
jgi:hypothetical protein